MSKDEQQNDQQVKHIVMTSEKSWEDLKIDKDFIKTLREQKFEKPSIVQQQVLEKLQDDKSANIFVEAPTGSGKTLAYLLIAQQVIDKSKQNCQVLILAHTVVLVKQIASVAQKLNMSVSLCVGIDEKIPLDVKKQIIVSTPQSYESNFMDRKGRGGKQAALNSSSTFKLVIIDEADYFYEQGNQRKIKEIINHLKKCQIMLFSATLEEAIRKQMKEDLFSKSNRKPQFIQSKITLSNYYHVYVVVKNYEEKMKIIKDAFELDMLESGFQSIIFCKTKKGAEEIYDILVKEGISVSLYHSGLKYEQKEENIQKYINGETTALIATDMFSRGIDISTAALIINFDLPCDKKGNSEELKVSPVVYVHRTGRAGRFGKKGISLSLIYEKPQKDDDLNTLEEFKQIQDFVKQKYNTQINKVDPNQMNDQINEMFEDEKENVEAYREQQRENAKAFNQIEKSKKEQKKDN